MATNLTKCNLRIVKGYSQIYNPKVDSWIESDSKTRRFRGIGKLQIGYPLRVSEKKVIFWDSSSKARVDGI